MRVAVLADLHANLPATRAALAAVDACRPDRVVVAGDVINRGPRPRECLELVLERAAARGWRMVKGNHEEYVLKEAAAPGGRPDWERKLCQHTGWTLERVRDLLPAIAAWPDAVDLDAPDGSRARCVHASRLGNRAGLYAHHGDAELAERVEDAFACYCAGHTHIPFQRRWRNTLVVNAGAVGMPFDGDPRAAFALLEWTPAGWTARIERVPYDRAETERDYHATGYLRDGGPMVRLILRELHTARPRLGEWHRLFEHIVAQAHITIEQSVEDMLSAP